jgi:tetratricopeptide (TPR) repeat protein
VRIQFLAVVVAVLLSVLTQGREARAFVRHTIDDQELLDVRTASPAAADAYVQAEQLLRAGDLAGAEKLLAKALELRPNSFLLARRHCQVLTELGQRDAALAACKVALSGASAMDARAYIGALMSAPGLAKPKELADAVREAVTARRLTGQPFADAAFCDIANHIGDNAMFTRCLTALEKSAPGYFETTRWRSARGGAPVWLLWAGWAMLGALGVFTAGHAFLRWFRNPAPRARKAGAAATVALACSVSFTAPARAEEPAAAPSAAASAAPADPALDPANQRQHFQLSHFVINFDDPESQIPTIKERNLDPLEFGYFLQDLAAEALKAERKKDYRYAVKFWRASAKAVPDEAIGFSRVCRTYQILEERENALPYCARALVLHGATAEDYLRFSDLMVASPGALTADEIKDMDEAIAHLRAQPDAAEVKVAGPAAVMECQLGVKEDDEKRLANCTSILAKTAPNDPHTLTFQWSLAMKRHDYSEARRLLAQMATTKMLPDAQEKLRAATDKAATWWRRPFTDPRYGFGTLFVIALGALLVIRKRAQLREMPPPGAAPAS